MSELLNLLNHKPETPELYDESEVIKTLDTETLCELVQDITEKQMELTQLAHLAIHEIERRDNAVY